MKKINFVNNQTPAGATTMNTFQNNIENEFNSVKDTSITRSTLTTSVVMKSGYNLNDERKYFVARNNMFDLNLMMSISNLENSFPTVLTTVATIPAEYAPLRDLFFPVFADNNNGSQFQTAICRITKDGSIDVAATTSQVKRVDVRHVWMR